MSDYVPQYMRTDNVRFKEGEEVVYMPSHVNDPFDKDAKAGVVVDVLMNDQYMVDYESYSFVGVKTNGQQLYSAHSVYS